MGEGTKPPVDLAFDEHNARLWPLRWCYRTKWLAPTRLRDSLPTEYGLPIADLTPRRGEEQILDHVFRADDWLGARLDARGACRADRGLALGSLSRL